ncbi:MAG: histidine phosphatase family protein [Acetobacteraceae bacterium]
MPQLVTFITHPDVAIDPAVPVPDWKLSPRGRARMTAALAQPWIPAIRSIWCSTERKAIDAAEILARHLSLPLQQHPALGENDRSATGYLPKAEFEAVADAFFAHPTQSIRGWERAIDAQQRIVTAVQQVLRAAGNCGGDIAIVAHGGVGTLLLCHLLGQPIDRAHDQPPGNGGNYFMFEATARSVMHGWRGIDP